MVCSEVLLVGAARGVSLACSLPRGVRPVNGLDGTFDEP